MHRKQYRKNNKPAWKYSYFRERTADLRVAGKTAFGLKFVNYFLAS